MGARGRAGRRSVRRAHHAPGNPRGQRVPEPAQPVLQRGHHERAGLRVREHGVGPDAHRRGDGRRRRAFRAGGPARPQPVQALRGREAEDRLRERVGPRPAAPRSGRAGVEPGRGLHPHAGVHRGAVEGRGAHGGGGGASPGLPAGRGRPVRARGGRTCGLGEDGVRDGRAVRGRAACRRAALGAARALRARPRRMRRGVGRARRAGRARGAFPALRLREGGRAGRGHGGALVSARVHRGRAGRQRRGQVDVRAVPVRSGEARSRRGVRERARVLERATPKVVLPGHAGCEPPAVHRERARGGGAVAAQPGGGARCAARRPNPRSRPFWPGSA